MSRESKNRKFEARFDGDEIDGKRYALGAPISGLDGPTAAFLVNSGRIREISDERHEKLVENFSGKAKAKPTAKENVAAQAKAKAETGKPSE